MPLAVIGVVTSVVGAFYYLRIIRLMYFDDDTPLDGADGSRGQPCRIFCSLPDWEAFLVPLTRPRWR